MLGAVFSFNALMFFWTMKFIGLRYHCKKMCVHRPIYQYWTFFPPQYRYRHRFQKARLAQALKNLFFFYFTNVFIDLWTDRNRPKDCLECTKSGRTTHNNCFQKHTVDRFSFNLHRQNEPHTGRLSKYRDNTHTC